MLCTNKFILNYLFIYLFTYLFIYLFIYLFWVLATAPVSLPLPACAHKAINMVGILVMKGLNLLSTCPNVTKSAAPFFYAAE